MINILDKKNLGVAVLLLTVTLLMISTLLILFTAQYSSLQQKITATLYQNQQAFEAAQAGLEAAIPYYQTNYNAIITQQQGGYLQPYINSSTQNVVLANGSKYTFVYTNPIINNFHLVSITSTGTSADGTSTRTISQQIQSYSSGPPAPTVTLSTQGNVTLKNSASLNNIQTNSNINAGGSVSFANSSETTTSSGVSSNSSRIGSDVTQNNTSLANMTTADFFKSIFGVDQSTVQNNATYTYTNNTDTTYNNLNGITGAVIWINQTGGTAYISNLTTIGTAAQPVILVVNGNLDLDNNVTIYGLVFVMNASSAVFETNSVTINGAIASTTSLNFANSATLNYSSAILNALPSVTGTYNYGKVPGSWKDF